MKKRILLLLLSLVLCLGLLPMVAFAAEPATVSTEEALRTAVATEGTTVTLGADITLTSQLTINAANITIDGAGYTITGDNTTAAWSSTNGSKFLIEVNGVEGVTLQNVILKAGTTNAPEHGVQFYTAGGTLSNVTIDGFEKSPLNINASTVKATGALTVQNSGWFEGNMINVSYGSGIPSGYTSSSFDFSAATVTAGSIYYDSKDLDSVSAAGGSISITPNTSWGYFVTEGSYSYLPQVAASISGKNYATLGTAVAMAVDGDTITLCNDFEGGGVEVQPGKFNTNGLTIDLNGHTYTVNDPAVGSQGTETQGFHLEKNNKITFKNGVINAKEGNKLVVFLIQNYSDLTLDGVTLDGTKLAGTGNYTLSNNNGIITVKNNSAIIAKEGQFAFDVYYGWDYPSVEVNVEDATVTGKVQVYKDSTNANSTGKLNIKGGDFTKATLDFANAPATDISITGGTFAADPSTYLATGYYAYAIDDTTYGVRSTHENVVFVAANAASCKEEGNVAYYQCNDENCGKVFEDIGCTKALTTVVAPKLPHTEVVDAAVPATCTTAGKTEGKHCSVCSTVITAQTDVPASGHALEKVPGKAATCSADGTKDSWKCPECDKLFADENGTTQITAAEVIKATAHTYVNGICTVCNAGDPTYVVPSTNAAGTAEVEEADLNSAVESAVASDTKEVVVTTTAAVPVTVPAAAVDKVIESQVDLTIQNNEVTTTFDAKALEAISEANTENEVIALKVEPIAEEKLNAAQQQAAEKVDAQVVLKAEAFVGDKKVSDFKGGKVTVTITVEVAEGESLADYTVAYINDAGEIERCASSVSPDGKALVVTLTHFSEYVVAKTAVVDAAVKAQEDAKANVETSAPVTTPTPAAPAAPVAPPNTGDNSNIALWSVVLLACVCGSAVLLIVKKRIAAGK